MTKRPPTIQERKNLVIANTETERKKKADSCPQFEEFSSSDFSVIKLPKWQKPTQPYGGGFPLYLARHLRAWPNKEVEGNLHVCFPEWDNVDCDYLKEVVEEIWLQEMRAKDRPMFVNTPGSGKLFVANVAKVNKWIKKQRLRLPSEEDADRNPIEATLPFNGTISSVVELLYRLEKQGKISLLDYRGNHGNLNALARTLCRIFPPIGSSSKNAARALELELRKIPVSKLGPGKIDENVLAGMGKKRSTYPSIDHKEPE